MARAIGRLFSLGPFCIHTLRIEAVQKRKTKSRLKYPLGIESELWIRYAAVPTSRSRNSATNLCASL